MITPEQMKHYEYQQTDAGREALAACEWLKHELCQRLNIPPAEIKTGKLTPAVNGFTGKLTHFFED